MSVQNRNLRGHSLRFRQLIAAAVGHCDRPRADRGVEAFYKPLLRADVQIRQNRLERFRKYRRLHRRIFEGINIFRCAFGSNLVQIAVFLLRRKYIYIIFLMRTVGIEEVSGKIDNRLASPSEHKAGRFCYCGNMRCLQILLRGKSKETVFVFRCDNNGHAFL